MKAYRDIVVLVRGASAGIGEAAAVGFKQVGAIVYGLASSRSTLEAARERHPEIRWIAADVTRRPEIDAAIKAVLDEGGRFDVLVNNAGAYKFAPIEAVS